MGNNAAFTAFEAAVIAVHNHGALTKKLLDELASSYKGIDIDRGGMYGTLAKDGLDVEDIILKLYEVDIPPAPELPPDYHDWTDEQCDQNDRWNELRFDAIEKIQKAWGWR